MRKRHRRLSAILNDNDFTAFEKKVFKAVSKIPPGQARSYGWVARMAGSPFAARAAGNALNKNPYPVIIPCHRVIKSDGSIGGYSKGIGLKKRLLAREGIDCTFTHCYNHKKIVTTKP